MTYDPSRDIPISIESLAGAVQQAEHQLGYSITLWHDSASISPSYSWACRVQNPDPLARSPLYGWGATWQEAWAEAAREVKRVKGKLQLRDCSTTAEAIRERHRAEAEREIAALAEQRGKSSAEAQ